MSDDTSDVSKVEGGSGAAGAEESARRGLEEEFNVQRARMKELFLQKEEELRAQQTEREQLQSEVLGLREELAQLQTLAENQKSHILNLDLIVTETVSASSAVQEEARQLRMRCAELEHQLRLQQQQQHMQDVSIAPATLVRSLARRLGADSEEQPKKPVEDGDLQRCEVEISQLKSKLRETDAQLQEALKNMPSNPSPAHASGDTRTDPDGARTCDMCANYEKQLVHEQREAAEARDRAAMLEHALKLATEELEGARSIHDETIRAWHSERGSSAASLEELRAAVEAARTALEARAASAQQASQRALEQVTTLTVDREELQRKLDSLERDNAMLVGRFTKKAEEMQNEFIDLPDNVNDLQLYALELREGLIRVQVGREEALAAERDLRAQLLEQSAHIHRQEAELVAARSALQDTRCVQVGREEALAAERDLRAQLLEQSAHIHRQEAELRAARSALQDTRCVQVGREEALAAERDLRAQLLEQSAHIHRQEAELRAARSALQDTRCVQVGREEALAAERDLRAQLLEQSAHIHRQEAELRAARSALQDTRCVQVGREEALAAERDLRAQLLEQSAHIHRQEAELRAARSALQDTRCVQVGREEALAAERDLRAQLLEQSAHIHRQEAELRAARSALQDTRCVQVGREEALAAERDLRAQLLEQSAHIHRQEAELRAARSALQDTREELDRLATEREQLQQLGGKLRSSTDQIAALLDDKKRLLDERTELRGRVCALQQELDNSEKVQQDFVRLSQSLQVQLQRIREADTEVRWQHDEDVNECPSCHVPLPNSKKKVHCRHCGRIFCGSCAAHSVPSGPRRAAARVCAVCRTLLQPDTAPYFSTAPPTDPD